MAFDNVIETKWWQRQGLQDWQLQRYTPSVMQRSSWGEVSDEYSDIYTIDVINALRHEGYEVVKSMQARSRMRDKRSFVKHAVTMVRAESMASREDRFSVHLVNSLDAGCAYIGYLGYLRYACSNGLVFGDFASKFRIVHRGNIGDVVQATLTLTKQASRVTPYIFEMQNYRMEPEQVLEFANYALQLRFGDKNPGYGPWDVAHVNRYDDRERNLWNVFNTLQENLIKGFKSFSNYDLNRAKVTKSVDKSIEYNTKLWDKALSYLQTDIVDTEYRVL